MRKKETEVVQVKHYDYCNTIKYEGSVNLNFQDAFGIILDFANKYPELVEAIYKANKIFKYKRYCPFPGKCNHFPCKELFCSSDGLSNGFPVNF